MVRSTLQVRPSLLTWKGVDVITACFPRAFTMALPADSFLPHPQRAPTFSRSAERLVAAGQAIAR
jgi:hypothetical protein